MKRFLLLLLSSILLLTQAVTADTSTTGPAKNVILIGWDGAQRNHVKECLLKGELPNLQKLYQEGSIVSIDITRTTDTKAGWTQILTGYEPEVTGVYNNNRYQAIPKGYTIFERLETCYGSTNIVTGAVIGKKAHVDAEGPQVTEVPLKDLTSAKKAAGGKLLPQDSQTSYMIKNDKLYRVSLAKPYYNAKGSMDFFINGLELNSKVGAKTLDMMEKHKDKPFFFFVHFAEIDKYGHAKGENSKQYNDALISSDYWTGEIVKKLKELNLYDKTLIYVTADHGFDEGMTSHNDAPYVFLATNDKNVKRNGLRQDITPTILSSAYGLELGRFTPALDGHPLTQSYQQPIW